MEGGVLDAVLKRIKERANVIASFVDSLGVLWVRTNTEKQAARTVRKLNEVTIMAGTMKLRFHQTQLSAWPPGFLKELEEATVPQKAAPTWSRTPMQRFGPYKWKGGARHKRSSMARKADWEEL